MRYNVDHSPIDQYPKDQKAALNEGALMMENRNITRRQFISTTSTAAMFTMGSGLSQALVEDSKTRSRKTILSFYCDDTGPYRAGVEAFEKFLDYCAEHGISGESSVTTV